MIQEEAAPICAYGFTIDLNGVLPAKDANGGEQATWLNLPPKELISWDFVSPGLRSLNLKEPNKGEDRPDLITLWANANYEFN